MKKYSESELIARCIKGQADAQRILYDEYSGLVYGICYRYAKNAEDARDVLQESFIKIFQHIGTFKAEGSFEGWIRKIAVNCAIQFYRSSIRRIDTGDVDSSPDPIAYAEATDDLNVEDLMKLISGMPDGYRIVFNLYAIEGYSHKEIGETLGITESSSRSQLTRARQLMMELVESSLERKGTL